MREANFALLCFIALVTIIFVLEGLGPAIFTAFVYTSGYAQSRRAMQEGENI